MHNIIFDFDLMKIDQPQTSLEFARDLSAPIASQSSSGVAQRHLRLELEITPKSTEIEVQPFSTLKRPEVHATASLHTCMLVSNPQHDHMSGTKGFFFPKKFLAPYEMGPRGLRSDHIDRSRLTATSHVPTMWSAIKRLFSRAFLVMKPASKLFDYTPKFVKIPYRATVPRFKPSNQFVFTPVGSEITTGE